MDRLRMYASAWCGYCALAKQLLDDKGVAYEELLVDADAALRQEMTARSGRTSVPQIFWGDRHLGGYDELAALDRSGELDSLLSGAS